MCTPPRTRRNPTHARAVGSSTVSYTRIFDGARAALEEEVVQQVQLEVSAGEHVRAGPEVPLGVHGQGLLTAGEEMVAVACVRGRCERGFRGIVASLGRPGEQQIDGIGDQLDVPELFRGDVRDQVVERPHPARVRGS